MEIIPGTENRGRWADAALAALFAAVCAAMGAAAVIYVLSASAPAGAAVCAGAVGLTALCALLPRFVGKIAPKRLALAVFIVALALRAAYVLSVESVPVSDFELLYDAARSLAQGSAEALESDYFRLWGYQVPFVLYESLILRLGGGETALALLNALWGAVSALLVFALAARFAGGGAAFAAALLYALCPDALMLTPALTNQCISLAFILLGVYLASSGTWKGAIGAGAALALGDLMRPEAVLALAGLAAAVILALLRREAGRRALTMFALLVLAYIALKLAVSGAIALSGIAPGGTDNAAPEWKFVLGLDTATGGTYDGELGYILNIQDDVERRAAALDAIRASLERSGGVGGVLMFFVRKAASFWGSFEESWLGAANASDTLMRYAGRAVFITMCGLAAAGASTRRADFAARAARAAVCVNFAAYLLIEIQPRYRYFVLPFLCVLAASGIERAMPLLSGHRRGKSV